MHRQALRKKCALVVTFWRFFLLHPSLFHLLHTGNPAQEELRTPHPGTTLERAGVSVPAWRLLLTGELASAVPTLLMEHLTDLPSPGKQLSCPSYKYTLWKHRNS